MKIFLMLVFSIYFLIAYSGCATIFSGGSEEINLSSDPSGAKVLVNGQNEGKTPMKLNADKGKDYILEFVKEGFENKTFRLTSSLGVGWLILDLFAPFGIIVDAITGNWNGFNVSTYKANLESKK